MKTLISRKKKNVTGNYQFLLILKKDYMIMNYMILLLEKKN